MKMIVYNVIEYKCVVVSISPHYILNNQQLFKKKVYDSSPYHVE